ncbi:MAG: hypothetical protein AAFR87_09420 [Bacteroidota bacterium]
MRGFAAKYQLLLSSLILAAFLFFLLSFPSCQSEQRPAEQSHVIYNPDSLSIISTSQLSGKLNAKLSDMKVYLHYNGKTDEIVKVRIYNAENNLIYGEKELTLLAEKDTPLDVELLSPGDYQVFVFFDDAEFLSTELLIPTP